MNHLMTRWIPFALLVAGLSAPGSAHAQQQRRRSDQPPNRAQIEQRIRAQMGRMMQERLGLNAEEAARLSDVVQQFDGRRRELADREQDVRRRAEEITRSGGDASGARELLQQQADLRMEEAQLFGEEQRALLDVLTPAQVLELQDLRQDIGRRIRALRNPRGDAQDGPRGPGPRSDGRIGERRGPPGGPPA
jgi:Spy/CpxP family protein refolding chaperone